MRLTMMNKVDINKHINVNKSILTVHELLNELKYDYSNIHFDNLWNSIKDDMWIYIDDNMVEYMGYANIRDGRYNILNILKTNFTINEDYKNITNDELNSRRSTPTPNKDYKNVTNEELNSRYDSVTPNDNKELVELSEINSRLDTQTPNNNEEFDYSLIDLSIVKESKAHNKTYLFVAPIVYKELLMLIKTNKGKEIRSYYIELEQIFKFYNKYVQIYNSSKLENMQKYLELEKEKNESMNQKIIEMKTLEEDEYVYICTNSIHDMNNIYKIGKCRSLKARLSSYNTGHLGAQKYYYCYSFKCHNSRTLEELIHNFLKPYSIKNEMYKIKFEYLKNIVEYICNTYSEVTKVVNRFIQEPRHNEFDDDYVKTKEIKLEDNTFVDKTEEEENEDSKKYLDQFKDFIENNRHKFKYDKNNKLKTCPRCLRDFVSHQRLTSHLRNNRCLEFELKEEQEKIKKEERKKKSIKNEIMANVLDIDPTTVRPEFICINCNKIYTYQYQYDKHIKNNVCTKRFPCDTCDSVFKNPTHLKRHVDLVHTNNDRIKCDGCGKYFKHKDSVRDHLNRSKECKLVAKEKLKYSVFDLDNISMKSNFKINMKIEKVN